MVLGRVGKTLSETKNANHADVESLLVSLGVMCALLLPAAMTLQYTVHDDKAQEKNFMLLCCNEPLFRTFVVQTLQKENFQFNDPLLNLDTRNVLETDSYWDASGVSDPEKIYDCAHTKEVAATVELLLEKFPLKKMNAWALMHPDSALWTDHINAMASFAMCILFASLLGSLFLYISFALSASADNTKAGQAWNSVGMYFLALNFALLIGGVIVLLFAQDAYAESQDPFFVRDSRLKGYSKIALLAVFLPITVFLAVGSLWSLLRACKNRKNNDESGD